MNFLFPFTTLSFAYPYLLLVPLVACAALVLMKQSRLAVPGADDSVTQVLGASWRTVGARVLSVGSVAGFILLAVAAARPQQVTILPAEREARNLMLVVDVSRSMEIVDFRGPFGDMSRMDAIKTVLSDFVKKRRGDRIGVAVFGQQAFLQAPLTADIKFLEGLLAGLQPRMAGDGTAMGEGLGVGLRRIQDVRNEARAMILITDGVSNVGSVNPLQAAQIAHDLGIVIHTIGIGSHTPIDQGILGGFMGLPVGRSEFDEDTLREIARTTGGVYRNAATLSGLQDIYNELDKVERTKEEEPERRLVQELFPQYLALSLLCFTVTAILSRSLFLRVP